MGRADIDNMDSEVGELTLLEIAEAVESEFGLSPIGLKVQVGMSPVELTEQVAGNEADAVRAAFVGIAPGLIAKQRMEPYDATTKEVWLEKARIYRQVKKDLAGLLGVDMNEVFRLGHRMRGLQAKDAAYRDGVQRVEREVARRYGMIV